MNDESSLMCSYKPITPLNCMLYFFFSKPGGHLIYWQRITKSLSKHFNIDPTENFNTLISILYSINEIKFTITMDYY